MCHTVLEGLDLCTIPKDFTLLHYLNSGKNFSHLLPKLTLSFLLLSITLHAQPQLTSFDDGVYRDYIRSVRLHVHGLALTQPIAPLGPMGTLSLSFDDLDGEGTRYYYTVIHCDRHWQPTQELSQFDYLHGYREGEIRNYDFSSGTYQDYLHYYLDIPNEDVKWSISGNYLLVVYEEGNEDDPIITRRFMVTEEKVKTRTNVVRPAAVSKQNTHQEIDFGIETKDLNSINPRMEIFVTLLQNGRWDNCMYDITPRMISGTYLDFNYQDKIVFEAGKEFRNMDISSMIYRSENVLEIEEFKEGFRTIMFPDKPRDRESYLWRRDLNGMFVPYNRDYTRKRIPLDSLASTLNLVDRYNYREQNLSTDYSKVIVTLDMPNALDRDVYIVGELTNWKLLPQYHLNFDEHIGAFVCELYLKQGYYNYGYAIREPNGAIDFSLMEGDWYATENQYTLLTYYRPRGGQYDQLVGALSFGTYYD